MFNAAKDAIAGKTAQVYVNDIISRYGKLERLKIDSAKKQIEVVCLPHGEPAPITINVGNYVIESMDGKKFIRLSNCTCSRPWLQNLLADFADGRRIELPGWAAAAL